MGILQLAAEFAQTGTIDLRMPRVSDWKITGYGETTASIDVADVVTAGAAYAIPVNVNVGGGTTEIKLYKPSANLAFKISGWGAKFGVAGGWNAIPGLSGSSSALSRAGARALNGATGFAQSSAGSALSGLADLPNGGIGTLLAGPRAPAVIAPQELEGFVTVIGGELNFGTNGMGMGIVIFGSDPIIQPTDLIQARAIGLVADVHFTLGKVDAGANYAVFHCKVEMESLATPGAYYGMSIPM